MRLVIFDVDGTLTQTMNADAECFVLQPTAAVPGTNGFMKVDCQACIRKSGSAAVAELGR